MCATKVLLLGDPAATPSCPARMTSPALLCRRAPGKVVTELNEPELVDCRIERKRGIEPRDEKQVFLAACLDEQPVAIARLHRKQLLGLAIDMEPALVEVQGWR